MMILLQVWDSIIADTLNPSHSNLKDLSDTEIQKLIERSNSEREKVQAHLIEGIIEKPKILDKQEYVQLHQAMLINLLDKLYSYVSDNSLNEKIFNLYNSIKQHLEGTLNFIEDFFSNYFDRNAKVPISYLTVMLQELCKQLQNLKKANQNINPELINILINNFKSFSKRKSTGITYNQLKYQKDLMSELLSDMPLSETMIKRILFYFNFNNADYIAYIYGQLTALIEPMVSKDEKITALHYEQKIINQLPVKLDVHLSSHVPSLKEQVNQWIDEEIKFIEANQITVLPVKSEGETDEKIHTSLSVAKIALIMRLMILDKIITNRVVAHVLRIVVRMFTTLQRENISFGSIETKYHNPDRGTISAVKDMLFRWINILGKL